MAEATGASHQQEQDQYEPVASSSRQTKPTRLVAKAESSYGHHYIFKRLKKDLPLPSAKQLQRMVLGLFMVMFLAGWNDASQGPLLPSLQEFYNVNYLVISVIWISNCAGCMIAGTANVFITDRLGVGIAAPFGVTLSGIGYLLMSFGGPFPLFVMAYMFNGIGMGVMDAQANSLVTRLPNASTTMNFMHAVYGLGATISPLISTEFVKRMSGRVYLYFLVSVGLTLVCIFTLVVTLQLRTDDQIVGRRGAAADSADAVELDRVSQEDEKDLRMDSLGNSTETTAMTKSSIDEDTAEVAELRDNQVVASSDKFKRLLQLPTVHYMAFYVAIYVGVEVTIGGWATSFLLAERDGDNNSGYVTTGFFLGLTLGRVVLMPFTKWIGAYNSIYAYSVFSIVLEVLIWTIPNLVANAVCFSLIGKSPPHYGDELMLTYPSCFFLGPIYPIVMMTVTDVVPEDLQGGSIGWIASLGSAGSAAMPFINGGLSNHFGPWVLQPLMVAFLALSLFLWTLVPRPRGKGWRV